MACGAGGGVLLFFASLPKLGREALTKGEVNFLAELSNSSPFTLEAGEPLAHGRSMLPIPLWCFKLFKYVSFFRFAT